MDAIRKLDLTWIKNNRSLALEIVLIACLMYSVNYGNKLHERFEEYLIQSKQKDLETAQQNFRNSQELLRLIK